MLTRYNAEKILPKSNQLFVTVIFLKVLGSGCKIIKKNTHLKLIITLGFIFV